MTASDMLDKRKFKDWEERFENQSQLGSDLFVHKNSLILSCLFFAPSYGGDDEQWWTMINNDDHLSDVFIIIINIKRFLSFFVVDSNTQQQEVIWKKA